MTTPTTRYNSREAYTNRAYVLGDDAVATTKLTRYTDIIPTSWYDCSTTSKAHSVGEIEDHASADLGQSSGSSSSHLADDSGN